MSLQAQYLQPGKRPNPNTNEPPLIFVACHLRQPPVNHQLAAISNNHSWGLWVSLQGDDKTALVVANIQKHSFDPLLQWSKTTAAPLDPSIVWNQTYGSYSHDLWKSYFSLSPSAESSHNTLLPGDVIVAINGLPISAFGGSIGIVTTYLQDKRCNELFLVAARSRTLEIQQQQQMLSKEQVLVPEESSYCLLSVTCCVLSCVSCFLNFNSSHYSLLISDTKIFATIAFYLGPGIISTGNTTKYHLRISCVSPP